MNSWQTNSTNNAGRLTKRYQTDGGGDSAWSDADDVSGDIVLSQQEFTYDAASNLILAVNRDRFHDDDVTAAGDTSANTDAGDQYTGLDRFGRVSDQVWRNTGGSVIDRYQYGYDRSGNRLSKNNLVDTALSELYGYDNLNQITSFLRGVLSDANSDGIFDTVSSPSRTQDWSLDAIGNWSTLTTNSTSQSRTHNAQNQVTDGRFGPA